LQNRPGVLHARARWRFTHSICSGRIAKTTSSELSGSQAAGVAYVDEAYRGLRRGGTPFAHLWEGRPELVRAFIRQTPQYRGPRPR